jgi:hypothetical protein
MQAKDLGLPRRDPGQRGAQPIGELGLFEVPGCGRVGGLERVPIGHGTARSTAALADAVHGAGRHQASQQGAPVPDVCPSRDPQGTQEGLLEALVGVGPVARDPIGRPPRRGSVPVQDFLPVLHRLLRRVDLSTQSWESPFFLTPPPGYLKRKTSEPRLAREDGLHAGIQMKPFLGWWPAEVQEVRAGFVGRTRALPAAPLRL